MPFPSEKRRTFRRAAALVALVQVPVVGMVVPGIGKGVPSSWTALVLALLAWLNLGICLHVLHVVPARRLSQFQRTALVLPGVTWWFACVLLVVPATGILAAGTLGLQVPPRVVLGLLGVGLAVAFHAVFVRTRRVLVSRRTVSIPDLPASLEGYRIAHLSDLHVGNFHRLPHLQRWAAMTNRLAPNIVAITGDLVDAGEVDLDTLCAGLEAFDAPDGLFVCPGNHDSLAQAPDYWSRVEETGAVVLRNRGLLIRKGSASVHVGGVDDVWQARHDMPAALAGAESASVSVLLAHDPRVFRQAARMGVNLTLAGHTHGGQVAVPFRSQWNLSARAYPYTEGLHRVGGAYLNVSRGLGTAGVPLRLGAAPEIILLELRAAPGNVGPDNP